MKDDGYRILIAPAGDDPVFAQREEGISHTPYDTERAFYSRIRAGDPEGVRRLLESYLSGGIVVGRMSHDPLTQMKYFAVCCVTLACRYAIAGGLGEQEAFNFSDKCIARIDAMTDGGKIVEFLSREAQRLAAMVGESRSAAAYSPPAARQDHPRRPFRAYGAFAGVSLALVQGGHGRERARIYPGAQAGSGKEPCGKGRQNGRNGLRARIFVGEPFHRALQKALRRHSRRVG